MKYEANGYHVTCNGEHFATCPHPQSNAQRLAERLNRAEEESQLLNALLDQFSKAKAAATAPRPA